MKTTNVRLIVLASILFLLILIPTFIILARPNGGYGTLMHCDCNNQKDDVECNNLSVDTFYGSTQLGIGKTCSGVEILTCKDSGRKIKYDKCSFGLITGDNSYMWALPEFLNKFYYNSYRKN